MQRFVEKQLPELLNLLYDAALEPSQWQAFLDALPKSFGGASGLLQFVDASAVTEYFSYGSDPSYEASFMAYYGKLNPYPAVGFHRLPVGTVLLADDYVSAVELKGTEFFHEWMTPQGITPDHFAISLYNEGSKAALLVVAPHAVTHIKHRKRYTSQLQLLAPHMVRAMDISRRVSAGRMAERSLGSSFEALGVAAFLLGPSRRVLLANDKAEALLRDRRLVMSDRFRCLRAAEPSQDAALALAIGGAMAACPSPVILRPVRLTSTAPGCAFLAWAIPMTGRNNDPGQRSHLAASLNGQPTTLVLLTPLEPGVAIPPAIVEAAFKLSSAEARLASAIVAGHTLSEYARQSGLSRNTVRNQLTSVFVKTGTTRQTELIALIVAAVGPLVR